MKICVIIPTYNNARTLGAVIDGVLEHAKDVLVIDDGSTDGTAEILKSYADAIQLIRFPQNQGKGMALRRGFEKAASDGFTHAITIDSDAQHFPEDIPSFVTQASAAKNDQTLLIGARNMQQSSVPKKSSFGNRFSNFWYWVETGIKLVDTQSGFRLYPLKTIQELTLYTSKFELEIEVIVKAAWAGAQVKNIPIQIHYDQEDRVSHFRPFTDFTRISILNTYLVLVAFLYIKPRNLFRRVKRIGFKRFLKEEFLGTGDSPKKKALSVFLGIAIGLSPFWGFHSVIVVSLAILLNLNKAIAFAFSNISLPPFIPFVIYCSATVGNFVLGQNVSYNLEDIRENFEPLQHVKAYLFGSFTLAICSAVVFGLLGYLIFVAIDKQRSTRVG